jgi:hypothetical protein
MQSKKTHEQQLNIIEKRVRTDNAGRDFDARADLARPAGQRPPEAQAGPVPPVSDGNERRMPRGVNQESPHNKHRGKPGG